MFQSVGTPDLGESHRPRTRIGGGIILLLSLLVAGLAVIAAPSPASAQSSCDGDPARGLQQARQNYNRDCSDTWDGRSGFHRCSWRSAGWVCTGPGEPVMPTPPMPTPPTPTPPPPTPPTPPSNPNGLIWGQVTTPQSTSWSRPALRVATTDPAFGSTVRRVTDIGPGLRHRNDYSRRQTENAEGTRYLTHFTATNGRAEWRVYDRASGNRINSLPINADGEPQWHPTNVDLIRHIGGQNRYSGDLRLFETHVRSLRTETIADLTSRLRSVWPNAEYMKDREEGSPSRDGNRYVWIVYDNNERPLGVVSYDLNGDRILGTRNLETNVGNLDAVSASPTGRYVVANYGAATYVYDANLGNRRTINNKADHSDIALDRNGVDSYVYVDFDDNSPTAGWVVAVNLVTLQRTQMFRIYGGSNTSVHISGKGYNKPGWIIASTYNCKNPSNRGWACDKVFAAEMVPNGRILNLAHTYNCGEYDYYKEAHGSVNRDFTRVYFNSDSSAERPGDQSPCSRRIEVYQIDVPSFS